MFFFVVFVFKLFPRSGVRILLFSLKEIVVMLFKFYFELVISAGLSFCGLPSFGWFCIVGMTEVALACIIISFSFSLSSCVISLFNFSVLRGLLVTTLFLSCVCAFVLSLPTVCSNVCTSYFWNVLLTTKQCSTKALVSFVFLPSGLFFFSSFLWPLLGLPACVPPLVDCCSLPNSSVKIKIAMLALVSFSVSGMIFCPHNSLTTLFSAVFFTVHLFASAKLSRST